MVHLATGSVRMICLDLDGTLFTPRKEISERSTGKAQSLVPSLLNKVMRFGRKDS